MGLEGMSYPHSPRPLHHHYSIPRKHLARGLTHTALEGCYFCCEGASSCHPFLPVRSSWLSGVFSTVSVDSRPRSLRWWSSPWKHSPYPSRGRRCGQVCRGHTWGGPHPQVMDRLQQVRWRRKGVPNNNEKIIRHFDWKALGNIS